GDRIGRSKSPDVVNPNSAGNSPSRPTVPAELSMRIPSELNRESLYRRRAGGSPKKRDDYRRLMRLAIALILVIVVMQQAGQPKMYRLFFPDATVQLAPSHANTVTTLPTSGSVHARSTPAANSTTELPSESIQQAIGEAVSGDVFQSVVDGATWRSSDFQAFYLLIALADQGKSVDGEPHAMGSRVSTLSLLQQPAEYQRRQVSIGGTLARVEPRQAGENPFGVESYVRLWIRPDDGSENPVLAIVPSVPDALAKLTDQDVDRAEPELRVAGTFLKRLAYRAQSGVELAPVIIGRLVEVPASYVAEAQRNATKSPSSATGSLPLWILLGCSGLVGLALAVVAMRRTSIDAQRIRRLRSARLPSSGPLDALQAAESKASSGDESDDGPADILSIRQTRKSGLIVWFLALGWTFGGSASVNAESALDLISGFDSQRVAAIQPVDDQASVDEVARLLYRLERLRAPTLESRLVPQSQEPGNALRFKGRIQSTRMLSVSANQSEYLEMSAVLELTIDQSVGRADDQPSTSKPLPPEMTDEPALSLVYTIPQESRWQVGDFVSGVGIDLSTPGSPSLLGGSVIASAHIAWTPQVMPSKGWELLSKQGVDLGEIDGLSARNGKPLSAKDTSLFYSMLRSADALKADATSPQAVRPIELLKDPKSLIGHWISVPVQIVRITRVLVPANERVARQQLDADHYYQLDAIGSLDKTAIRIEPPDGGSPIVIRNRYPISIVTKTLPATLREAMRDDQGNVTGISTRRSSVTARGFFFRLWSYESEFMNQRGGGDQVGPLIIAADLSPVTGNAAVESGLKWITWTAAGAVILAILATLIWSVRNSKRDAKLRRDQQARQQIDLPL
ncbi:MAG: hypothetical protein AAGA03_14860, partial [Planctomycetota bacterium]